MKQLFEAVEFLSHYFFHTYVYIFFEFCIYFFWIWIHDPWSWKSNLFSWKDCVGYYRHVGNFRSANTYFFLCTTPLHLRDIYIYRESKGFMRCIREIKFLSVGKIKFLLVYEWVNSEEISKKTVLFSDIMFYFHSINVLSTFV